MGVILLQCYHLISVDVAALAHNSISHISFILRTTSTTVESQYEEIGYNKTSL